MPQALICGINPFDFWKLTLKEISDCIKLYADRQETEQKNKLILNYESANLISYFVALRLDGKDIPQFYELYPDYDDKTQEDRDLEAYKAQWMAFAARHNNNRKNKEV